MEKKKVLFIAHHLTIGGAQKSMITALNVIDYDKYDVTLYLRKNRLELLNQIDERVKVIVNDDKTSYYRKPYAVFYLILITLLNLFGKKEKSAKAEKNLTDRIRKDMIKYETNHFFYGKHFDVAIAYIQGHTADIITQIDANKKYMFYHASVDEAHELHEWIFPYLDGIVAVADSVRDVLSEIYPNFSDKMAVINNYVDAEKVVLKSEEYEAIPTNSREMIICSCGRFTRDKGFDLALEAAKVLKEKSVDFSWYFIGDGPERTELEKLSEKHSLCNNVVFTGMQENPYPWIKGCDIYVQPSYEESFGLTIAEAKILGKPVVSTSTIGGCYLIKDGENGILTDISSEGIAAGIIRLISNEALRNTVSDNLQKVDYNIEKERYKKQWNNLLEAI